MLYLRFPRKGAEHLFEVKIFETFHIIGQCFFRWVEALTLILDRKWNCLMQICTAISAESRTRINSVYCTSIRANNLFRLFRSTFCAEVCGVGSAAVRAGPFVLFGERAYVSENKEQCKQTGNLLFESFRQFDLLQELYGYSPYNTL